MMKSRTSQSGHSLLSTMIMLAFVGIIGAAIVQRSGSMGRYGDKFRALRETNGAFSYVQGLADCSRITACNGQIPLFPPEGNVPVVAVPKTELSIGHRTVTLRAKCSITGGTKRVAVEMETDVNWKEIGAISCN